MIRLKYYLALFLLLLPICSYGQFFKRLGMKDGLSNPSVLAIYQDTLGRMWFGTNMGRSKMFARIKEVTGLTPNEFALKLKLEEALRMLQEEPQYNISEISYSLGFTSPRYFSRCFKAFYGVPPLTYRKGSEF